MSWTQTHRRWQALQEIEVLANAGATELPWNDEYADIFGDREGLAAALHYRWQLSRTAQLDSHLDQDVLAEQERRLTERNLGVLRLLRQHVQSGGTIPAQRTAKATVQALPRPVTGLGRVSA
ncbi:MAG: hypothetical protein JWQ74_2639 [Marmoricola sp.]|nr:hypothetical protein [Marmoricola sp.]